MAKKKPSEPKARVMLCYTLGDLRTVEEALGQRGHEGGRVRGEESR